MTTFPRWFRYMVGSSLFLSAMSVFARMAGTNLPSIQVVFGRALVTTVLSYIALRRAGVGAWGNQRGPLLARGLAGFVGLVCFFFAVTRLPLGAATVIHFTSPVFTVLLAGIFLGEGLKAREFSTALVSFGGLVLIARPPFLFGGEGLDGFASLVAVAGALAAAVAYLAVQRAAVTENAYVIVFWFSWITLIGSAPMAIHGWVQPEAWEWAAILGVGITTQVGQVLLTLALAEERAAKVMQVGYSQILFAGAWGLFLFGEVPHVSSAVGTLIIVTSLVVLTWPKVGGKRRAVARAATASAPPPRFRRKNPNV